MSALKYDLPVFTGLFSLVDCLHAFITGSLTSLLLLSLMISHLLLDKIHRIVSCGVSNIVIIHQRRRIYYWRKSLKEDVSLHGMLMMLVATIQ